MLMIVAVSVLFIGFIIGPANGATHKVDDDGSKDFLKVQDAIDYADDGDRVIVYDGVYYENVIVDKRLELSVSVGDNATINGGGTGNVVLITADSVEMTGFLVTGSGSGAEDAGIRLEADKITLSENHCDDNANGIYLTLVNGFQKNSQNWIIMNEVSNNRHGIVLFSSENCVVERNNIFLNSDAGISMKSSDHNQVENNECSNNSQGIHIQSSNNITIGNNSCIFNTGPGIYLEGTEDSVVLNNSCSHNENGIMVKDGNQNTIQENVLSQNENGLYLLTSVSNDITGNTMDRNTIQGIFFRGADHNTLTINTITGNPVGAHFIQNVTDPSEYNILNDNSIVDNEDYGVNADDNGDVTVNAGNNFWGHSSGPFHPDENPDGKGDEVTDFVDFDPWTHVPEGYSIVLANIDSITPPVVLLDEIVHMAGSISEEREIERYVWISSLDGEIYNGSEQEFDISDLSQGIHNITFNVIDFRGIWGVETSSSVTVHAAPTVRIVSILPSPALDVDMINFNGEGIDQENITQYSWRSSLDGSFYSGPLSTFDYQGLSNGTHTIFLKVMDEHGVWSVEVNDSLVINGKPVGSIVTVTPNPATFGDDVTFTGEGTDDGKIQRYKWVSDKDGVLHDGINVTFTISNLSIGMHNISLVVQDDLGTLSVTADITVEIKPFVVENKKPTIIVTGPEDGKEVSEKFKVKGTASDEDGTVTKVELSIDGGNWQTAQGTDSWSLVLDARDLTEGEHNISVRCHDGKDFSEVLIVMVSVVDTDDNGEGFIPAFELALLVAALGLVMFLKRNRRSRSDL